VDGTNHPTDEAERYSGIIESNLGKEPLFDLILLGMGDDGHTASIFPNQMDVLQSKNICETALHPSLPQHRISLTSYTINRAKSVVFMVIGKSKASMIRNVIVDKNKDFPATHIINTNTKWYLDEAAAAML